jgi:two-component system, chemotaxis family, protein-glutamate methylesterase/glutaminase
MSPTAAVALSPTPSSRTRVMIVDDSAVVRGLVSRWVTESGHFDVVGTAANGRVAIDLVDRAQPDIVLLDLDMPELDGIGTLPHLLKKRPQMSVIVVSTLTQRNADISLKCLSLGAVDCLPKPESSREVTTSAGFRGELIAKLQGLAASRHRKPGAQAAWPRSEAIPRPTPVARLRPAAVAPRCLLIGASTGGPRAVMQVIAGLGLALQRVPVLIVQHMPPIFTSVFAEQLRAHSGVMALEPQQGEKLVPGQIYVAPGGRHMGLARGEAQPTIRLDDSPPVNFCRPAVDVLFRDAAAVFGASALAVVLTGMGSDGTHGAQALVEAGAGVIVQDEATSIVWGMPGSIAKAGLAQDILPLERIAPALKAALTGSRA